MAVSRTANVVLIMVTLTLIVTACISACAKSGKGAGPPARGYHAMAYDAESDRVILYGGAANPNKGLHDTWAYDLETNTWRDMSPAQLPPGQGPMAYDVQSDRIVLFVGTLDDGGPAGETWAYDHNTNTWTNMQPAETPFALIGANMAYDAESDRVILFGGMDGIALENGSDVFLNDTWAYDLDSNTWTKMAPEVSPPVRNQHAMVYAGGLDRVLLFSGATEWGVFPGLDDTWAYDYKTRTPGRSWKPVKRRSPATIVTWSMILDQIEPSCSVV